jgi:hypothetical protein
MSADTPITKEDRVFGASYRIERAITNDGEPSYVLWRDFSTPFGTSQTEIAKNRDRAVLERAIRFLEVGE